MEILYEDNHLIAVNKQVSDLVQADAKGDEVLGDQIKAYIKKRNTINREMCFLVLFTGSTGR
jgi:23S rRNA-/tRNA-specific pseudouridylate synthase